MKKLSAYVIAQNEEKRIRRTLEALKTVADEIVVVDSGSTDATVAIAREYADKVVFHQWVSYSDQKHFAQELCSHDWVMMDDADEVVSPELAEEIRAWKQAPDDDIRAFEVAVEAVSPWPRARWMRRGDRVFVIRLYDRRHADMRAADLSNDRVTVEPGGRIGRFRNIIEHHTFLTLSQTLKKSDQYSTESMEKNLASGRTFPAIRLFTEFPINFLKAYIFGGDVLRGRYGLVNSMNFAYFRWLRIAKDQERIILARTKQEVGG